MTNPYLTTYIKNTVLAALVFLPALLLGQQLPQSKFNFGFEQISVPGAMPDHWMSQGEGYVIQVDTLEKHGGNNSISISAFESPANQHSGFVRWAIPARYEAKKIELRGYMKLQDVKEGVAGLLLRVDGAYEILELAYIPEEAQRGTEDWARYSVKVPYPKGADTIYITAYLQGNGRLWVDDFELFLDGKDIRKISPRNAAGFKAISDKEFDKGSGIDSLLLSPNVTENLATLGKIWGFLKYYHPAVARGEYNWDYELFRLLPRVLEVETLQEWDQILSDWVVALGEVEEVKNEMESEGEIKLSPDLGWIDSSDFSQQLVSQLTQIRNAERTDEHFYIGMDRVYKTFLRFKNENPYEKMDYPDAGFRLLALYRYWNYVQYYFPYKNLIGEDWDNVLKEFIPVFSAASNELEYKLAVLSLITRIHDSHAVIMSKEPVLDHYRGLRYAAVELSFVEGEAVVSGYHDKGLGKSTGLLPGDIIEQINGKPVEEIIRERFPFTPGSNDATRFRDLAPDLLRTNAPWINVNYSRNGTSQDTRIQSYPAGTFNIHKSYPNDTCFKLLSPEVAYLYGGTVTPAYIPSIIDALESKSIDGLIIDMRTRPYVSYYDELCDYLLPKTMQFSSTSTGSVMYPGLFTIDDEEWVGKRNRNFFKGKVVILINEYAQSGAEFHTMAFQVAPNVTLIGSHTAGADGNMIRMKLPGGVTTSFSGVGIYYPDGTETQRVGIVPDIVVKPTIEGIREGRDEVLERALQLLSEGS